MIQVIDTVYSFHQMLTALAKEPILSLDTETVGNGSAWRFKLAERMAVLSPLVLTKSGYAELLNEYTLVHKRRNKDLRERLDKIERSIKRFDATRKSVLTKAQTDISGLQFWNNQLGMVQLGTEDGVYLIRASKIPRECWDALGELLERCLVLIIHNAQFDWKVLKQHTGISLSCNNVHDTYIAERILTNGTFAECGLKEILKRRFDVELSKDRSIRVSNWLGEWTEEMAAYAAADVSYLHRLKDIQRAALTKKLGTQTLWETYLQERTLLPINCTMEMHGVGVDYGYIDQIKKDLSSDVKSKEGYALSILGGVTNLNSSQQVLVSLQEQGVNVKDTNKKTLSRFEHLESIAALLDYRKYYKLLTTYFTSFREQCVQQLDGSYRIFAEFNPNGTDSGRYSSSRPNFQNLPREGGYRALVVPRPDWLFINADTAQIELRILAELSGDPVLIEAFQTGKDPHKIAAALVFGVRPEDVTKEQRTRCKAVGFGIIYGQTAYGLSNALGIDEKAAQDLIDRYMRNFYRVQKWIEETKEQAASDGFATTLGGRVRYFEDVFAKEEWKVNAAKRAAVNHRIQGTAADGFKEATIIFDRKLEESWYDANLVLVLHDEWLVESHPACVNEVAGILKESIKEGYQTYIKGVTIEVGDAKCNYEPLIIKNWAEAKA